MEFLIACDLEGIHGVVGLPYETLTGSPDYAKAIEGAILEINTVTKTLFENGATKVAVWDNHGGGENIDFSKLDDRIIRVSGKGCEYRFDFTKQHDFKAIIFLGYHAKEGEPGGVLAHSYNSKAIQYIKLDGKAVGELTVDTLICKLNGITPILCATDDVALKEITELCNGITTVVTKIGKGRNAAELKEREEVLTALTEATEKAVKAPMPSINFTEKGSYHLEIRYTRAEKAGERLAQAIEKGLTASYGEDTHVVHYTIDNLKLIPKFL